VCDLVGCIGRGRIIGRYRIKDVMSVAIYMVLAGGEVQGVAAGSCGAGGLMRVVSQRRVCMSPVVYVAGGVAAAACVMLAVCMSPAACVTGSVCVAGVCVLCVAGDGVCGTVDVYRHHVRELCVVSVVS
jgi:hypothetical protein